MPDGFEARAVIRGEHREVIVRPASDGCVWLRVPGGLDADNELAVDVAALTDAMAWVDEQNPRGEE